MPKVRVRNIAVSTDGYVAGPNQSLENPLGEGGPALHEWVLETRTGRQMFGQDGGDEGLDDEFVARGDQGIGATIMGRNMFGPIRGPWTNDEWKGWWGDEPPYHHPVFVLTHHPRPSIAMEGGTTFHFVENGIEAALEQAIDAAKGRRRQDRRWRVHHSAVPSRPPDRRHAHRDRAHPPWRRRAALRPPRRWAGRLRVRRVRQLALRCPHPLLPHGEVMALSPGDVAALRAAERSLVESFEASDPTAWVDCYTNDAVFVAPGMAAIEGREALLAQTRAR